MIRRAIAMATGLGLALAATALAQSSPDVPPGPGSIRGRLVKPGGSAAGEGVEVVLYGLKADGQAGLRRTRSDAQGEFAFEAIDVDPSTVYLVGARVSEVPFGARVSFEPGELERRVELEIFETTDATQSVTATQATLRASRGCAHVRVWHTHRLRNGGDRVVQIPPDDREGRDPLLAVVLPPGHTSFETPPGGQGVTVVDGVATFWGPLYPGEQVIEFGYGLEGGEDSVELPVGLPGGAPELVLLVPPDDLDPSGSLEPREALERDGRRYRRYAAGAIVPGGGVQFRLAIGPSPDHALATPRTRMWLELDDAALDVNEIHALETPTAIPASAPPLLCIQVPPGAADLRFSPEALDWGLTRDPSGALALHGPLPPGATSLALHYRLPVDGNPARFERHFESPVALLELLIADTGVVPESARLHPRRPVRGEDRNFLQLEAFAIESGEIVSLDLLRIDAVQGLPSAAAIGFVVLGTLATLYFLTAPLRPGRSRDARDETEETSRRLERDALYRSIEDLDEDFETGKLSAEDHEKMRKELRARAVALLRKERAGDPAAVAQQPPGDSGPADAAATPRCAACDAARRPEDRFCSRCGARVEAEPAP